MRKRLIAICCAALPALAPAVQWEFAHPGDAGDIPTGWSDASQSMSPPATAPGPYQVTVFDQHSVILFQTEASTQQRPKIRTNQTFTTGVYIWRVYIPDMEDNAQVSAGAFLYSDQSGGTNAAREIDFEIGPGKASVRAGIPDLPADALLAYLTVQRDDAAGRSGDPGSSLIFQPADPADHILPDNWYTLTLELGEDVQGRYTVDWYIQRDGRSRVKARDTYTTAYGPNNAYPTDFRIYNSLENLLFMGDALPTRDHVIYFDRTAHTSADCSSTTGTHSITAMETDTTSAGFPPGSDGEWTRFGAAYNGLFLTTDPAEVDQGTVSLKAAANFAAGTKYGLRYNLPATLDLECADAITWRMTTDAPGLPQVAFVFEETDGDIWTSRSDHSPTAEWTGFTQSLAYDDLTLADASGGGDLDLQLASIGFDLLANGAASGTPSFFFDDIQWEVDAADSTPTTPELPLVTSIEPPDFTTGAFPPDPSASGFPGAAAEGEWTRFGAAYAGLSIAEDSGLAADGTAFLSAAADWSAGGLVGVRYLPYGQPVDWSAYNALRASLRAETAEAGTTQQFALFEADGDAWTGPQLPVSTTWEDVDVRLPDDLTLAIADGDGVFNPGSVVLIGWNFANSTSSQSQTLFLDNIRLVNLPSALSDWLIIN